jgi:RNA polymerase sigma-70 factor (ECF subfamily)
VLDCSGLHLEGSVTSRRFVSLWFHFGNNVHCLVCRGEVILQPLRAEGNLELFTFDKEYVDRLRDGEPSTEQHFVSYFGQILGIMLRARFLPPERVDDVRQETFTRVIAILRRDGGIRQPERFGAFVNSICKNVLRESTRDVNKTQALQPDHLELPNKVMDIERAMISRETKEKVREILAEMKERDRDLLRAIFLEEKDKDEICREFGVEREYLRVLLHRAKERFRANFQMESASPLGKTTGSGMR